MRKQTPIIALLIIVVISTGTIANGYNVVEFPICTETGDQGLPDISGNNVVWADNRADEQFHKIYGKDLSLGNEFSVSTSQTHITHASAVDGDIVVWADYRNMTPQNDNDFDFYGYNISTQTEFVIWADGEQRPGIDIAGDLVVGVERSYHNLTSYDIYGYNLSTQTRFLICDAPDYQYEPRTNGDVVVWQDLRAGAKEWDVYGYDLSQSTEFPVSLIGDSEASQLEPAISGDIVVWGHSLVSGQGNQSIYAYDLTTETQSLACTSASSLGTPAVSGNFVVWQDNRNGNWDIYGYDLLTQTEFPVATSVGDQMRPTIDGNVVVWEDYRNGNGDIYGAYIPEPSCLILVALGSLLLLKKYRQ